MRGTRDTWRVPFGRLGTVADDSVPRAIVRVAPPDALHEHGGGLVCHDGTFDLGDDGEVDEEQRETVLRDRAANRFAEVSEQLVGRPWLEIVVHGPISPEVPHVDVYSFAPRGAGQPAWLLTAGMSTRLMAPGPGPGLVELGCPVRPDLGAEVATAVMRTLLGLGLYPWRYETFLGPGHDVP